MDFHIMLRLLWPFWPMSVLMSACSDTCLFWYGQHHVIICLHYVFALGTHTAVLCSLFSPKGLSLDCSTLSGFTWMATSFRRWTRPFCLPWEKRSTAWNCTGTLGIALAWYYPSDSGCQTGIFKQTIYLPYLNKNWMELLSAMYCCTEMSLYMGLWEQRLMRRK